MPEQRKKLVIDRCTWVRGRGGVSKLLLDRDEESELFNCRCCLGFEAKQLWDLKDIEIRGVPGPASLCNRRVAIGSPIVFNDIVTEARPSVYRQTDLGRVIIQVNDDRDIPDTEREAQLRELFAQRGIDIEFIN